MPQDLDHVIGPDIEGVGGEGGVEEALGLGLAANLHVEHSQSDGSVGAGGVGGCAEEEGAFGGVILAAVGQPFAQGRIKGSGPGVVAQGGQLRGGRADGVDKQPARRRQAPESLLVARVLGYRLPRRGVGVHEPLVGDVQIGQQDVGRCEVGIRGEGPLRLGPARCQTIGLQIGLAEGNEHLG